MRGHCLMGFPLECRDGLRRDHVSRQVSYPSMHTRVDAASVWTGWKKLLNGFRLGKKDSVIRVSDELHVSMMSGLAAENDKLSSRY